MSYSYLTNILITKQIIRRQNCAKLFKNGQHSCRNNNPLREQSSSSSREFSQSIILNKNVHNETTKSTDSSRNFSTSSPALSNKSGSNKNKEKKLNYILAAGALLYSSIAFYLRYVLFCDEDNVYIEPKDSNF